MNAWCRAAAARLCCSLRRWGLAAFMAAAGASAMAAGEAGDPPVVHALLIGIADYEAAGLAALKGPENDVKLMREVLTTRFHVPPANVRLLLNPTHGAIEREFVALRQRVKPHDFVYIHYSGHGSTAPDPAEPRGEDQTWVAFGARAHKLAGLDDWDVLDKEIAQWLQPLYELTDDVVFVSDSCHSGTVSRGLRTGVRSGEPVVRAHPLLGKLPPVPPPAGGVRIGAARDFETAVELDHRSGGACDDPGRCYGVFTWNWAQALRESRPGEAWGDVFDRANARITTAPTIYQRPQIEGRADRAVFAGRFAALTPSVEVVSVEGGKAVLNTGALSGASVGSTYRSIVSADAVPAVLKLTSVEPLTSTASVQSGAVRAGQLASETLHAYVAPRIRLHVAAADPRADAEWVAKLRKAIDDQTGGILSGFVIEDAAERADWWLYLVRPREGADRPLGAGAARRLPEPRECSGRCEAPQLWVVSRQGALMDERMRFQLARYDDEMSRLVNDLRGFAWSQEVRRLAAQGNATPVRMRVTVLRPPAGDTRKCAEGSAPGSGWARFGPSPVDALATKPVLGDCLSVELDNHDAERSWYGYVIAIGPDLAVQPVMPEPGAGSDAARIPPGESLRAPGRFYRLSQAGRETLMLMASDGPVRVQALQQSGLRDEPKSRLESLLATAAARRGEVETTGTWGAASVDFEIAAR
ncbi:MAG TPA: caspase family protein [Albitalea sp.]|nr:caspase family protein [Albitalea sp.]